ncbi:murein biosynthesis integral membrane protein MurJ [Congregibacter brevis]|uniref:Probable lipid II flippase MurJ n=1 Tax=Congregibacter brevis TaxID=3081201 RepID=A0ABZ0IBL7_9GAMM|nr:murein biosynthesis integral membrane protein MurJ [Congregibacter sp. IMCC45268]
MTQEPASEKHSGLLRSSAVVGVMTMLSRVLGLARDVILAAVLGASANADAFFIAFKIPNFLRRLFAEGAFAQAFVPVLAECRENGGQKAVRALVDRVAGVLGGVLFLLTALTLLAAPLVAGLFAPGYIAQPEKFALTAGLIRITFPYLMLISLTGMCGAILNSYGRFAVPAFTPVLLNLSLIAASLLVAPYFSEPAFALAWGVLFAGLIQLLFQMPFLYRLDLVPRPRWEPSHPGVRQVMTLMIPALFGVSVSQLNLLFDTVLASFLPTGSVSWLYYSDRLTELPLGVFAIAVATVIMPTLAAQKSAAREEDYSKTLDWAVRSVLLVGVPSTVALLILAEPILISLFHYGALSENDIAMSALSLRAYSLGLCAFMLIKVLAPGFYARQDMVTPVRIGIKAMVANMVMNLVFVVPLMLYFGVGHVGLALATSLSAFLNAGLLWRGLRREGVYRFAPVWRRYLVRLVLACLCMALVLMYATPDEVLWFGGSWGQRAVGIIGLCGAGLAMYLIVLWGLGMRLADLRAPAFAMDKSLSESDASA